MIPLVNEDTICALSTAPGMGAIAVLRVSGPQAFAKVDAIFSKSTQASKSHTVRFGTIRRGDQIVDEVVATIFKGPNSFTGEDVVEISCHGSTFIQQQILQLLLEQGCRMANPGEFTMRAFMHGKMDLSQAEAVGDLIASTSAASHRLAMNQMRGGVSDELKILRQKLIDFASLVELELDFGEEDVEFADRTQLKALIDELSVHLRRLIASFSYGNAIKQGVPTAILGKPNAGKSTLLNAFLQENRAIVSDIAGTTRDVIEDRMVIDGVEFRLQDTAGVRETSDVIESEGVSRSIELANKASLLLYLFDPQTETEAEAKAYVDGLQLPDTTQIIFVANKADLLSNAPTSADEFIYISAKEGHHIDTLKERMSEAVKHLLDDPNQEIVITNLRHIEALDKSLEALALVHNGMDTGVSGDFLAMDIRQALYHLGTITGEVTVDDLLGNIFGRFCIGK